eukprot:10804361-Lingulodinium_polyedra.AAC.1
MSAADHGRALQWTPGARWPRLQTLVRVASGRQSHHGPASGSPGARHVRERGIHAARVPGGHVASTGAGGGPRSG